MEQELIIAEILRNKPQGIKLYSPIFGDCTFCYIKDESSDICVRRPYNEVSYFNFDGVYHVGGECLLFPSKEMQDWSKFAWKKGDILVNQDKNIHLIFEKFIDDTYTIFAGKHCYEKDYRNEYNYERRFDSFKTEYFTLETEDAAQKYLKTIEEKLGGKLNRETLEIKKTQSEFKDGDIVALVVRKCTHIAIFQSRQEAYIGFHAVLCQNDELLLEEPFREDVGDIELRLATDSEKQQLFAALEKEGKRWDSEKKQIVDLKPKVELKPFDKVLVRDRKSDKWRVNLYGYKSSDEPYYCVYASWNYCIPYEGNEHLLGTTKNVGE